MSPQRKVAIISLDGINLSSRFILKEMSIHIEDEDSLRHFVFSKPVDLQMTAQDRRTENYCKRVLGAVGINEYTVGSVQYYGHISILNSLADFTIYCAGHVAYKSLTSVLPYASIYVIQDISTHTFPNELPNAFCGISQNPRYCSLAKLWHMAHFVNNVLQY